jgi:HEAT repeat protein
VRKRLLISATTLLLILIGLIVWEANRAKEPQYKGKPLSFWLNGNRTSAEAKEAVDHLGTNCIPTLLIMLQAEDSKSKRELVALTYDVKFIRNKLKSADDANGEAWRGFHYLGPRAQGAVGALIKLFDESPPDRKYVVAKAFSAMGPYAREAVPTLLHTMTTSTNEDVRALASRTLGEIGQDPDLVLPVMIKALSDPSETCRNRAALSIACYGTNAASAVPALIAAAKDPSAWVRTGVLIALSYTHGDPRLVVPVLTNALTDPDNFENAARALVEFGTNSISAVPQLVMLAASTNANVRDFAVITLGELHLRPDITIPILTKTLVNSDYSMRAWAASGLGNFGNDAKPTVPAMIAQYLNEQKESKPYDFRKSERMEMIRTALLKIDPAAAAQAGIDTNTPAL